MIPPATHVSALLPYPLATLNIPSGKELVSLSQNESLRPPSPKALEAGRAAMAQGALYPDPDWQDVRQVLARTYDVTAENILCGNGSMELIAGLTHAYAGPGNAVLAPAFAYPFFGTAARLVGARFDVAPETDARVSVEALLAARQPDTRIVFVANPGNPTGTRIARSELVMLRDRLPPDVLLVIDEAYGEFADHLQEPMFDLVDRGNTVVLRTLSKAYGLAGLRVGWGVFPPAVLQQVRKVINPNNISVVGQAAATAALADQAYMHETCAMTAHLRDTLRERLKRAGLVTPESFTNFVLVRFGSPTRAASAFEALRREGIVVRPQTLAGLEGCLRVTVGPAEHLDRTASLLEQWTKGDRT